MGAFFRPESPQYRALIGGTFYLWQSYRNRSAAQPQSVHRPRSRGAPYPFWESRRAAQGRRPRDRPIVARQLDGRRAARPRRASRRVRRFFLDEGLYQRRARAGRDGEWGAGAASLHGARGRYRAPSDNYSAGDRSRQNRRPPRIRAREYAAFHHDHRGDGSASSQTMELDSSPMEDAATGRAPLLLRRPLHN